MTRIETRNVKITGGEMQGNGQGIWLSANLADMTKPCGTNAKSAAGMIYRIAATEAQEATSLGFTNIAIGNYAFYDTQIEQCIMHNDGAAVSCSFTAKDIVCTTTSEPALIGALIDVGTVTLRSGYVLVYSQVGDISANCGKIVSANLPSSMSSYAGVPLVNGVTVGYRNSAVTPTYSRDRKAGSAIFKVIQVSEINSAYTD